MANVKLVFFPETDIPEGHFPSINIANPYQPTERVIPDLIEGDPSVPGSEKLFFFEMPESSARKVLEGNAHIYLLWEPESFKFMQPTAHGTTTPITLTSVKSLCANGEKNFRKPSLPMTPSPVASPVTLAEPLADSGAKASDPIAAAAAARLASGGV